MVAGLAAASMLLFLCLPLLPLYLRQTFHGLSPPHIPHPAHRPGMAPPAFIRRATDLEGFTDGVRVIQGQQTETLESISDNVSVVLGSYIRRFGLC